jgi:predicted dehydrogenase
MKFLIAGLGSIGRRHLRNLVSLGERDVILYRTHRSTMPEEDLAGYPVYTNLEEAFAAKPDAVVIANPTALHMQVAIPAANHGIHILLEKPISHNHEQVDELVNAVTRNKVKALVGFQYRFHPSLRKLKEIVSAGTIGTPVSCRVHWGEYLPDWHPWEDFRKSYAARQDLGGGVVLTLCHPFDYLRWMFGEVDSLWAQTAEVSELPIGAESTTDVGLRFVNGMLSTVHLDYIQRPGVHTLEVVGTQGTLRWDNSTGALNCYLANTREWTVHPPPIGFERNHLFIAEMQAFLDLLQEKASSPCSLQDGIKALDITLAVLQSAREKRIIELRR